MRPGARTARPRHLLVAALYVGAPLTSLFVFNSPPLTLAVTFAASCVIAASAIPVAFIVLVAFLSAAVPKAGLIVGGLPLPLMMFALLASAFMLRWRVGQASRQGMRLALLALLWLVYRVLALILSGGAFRDVAALAGWYGLPLVLLTLGPPFGSLRLPTSGAWVRWLEAGVLFACGFSVVQLLLGIEETAIPGVTRAVGADYSRKPLLFEGGSKIPSSYQNGNILGVVTAVFFVISAQQMLRGHTTRRHVVIMVATAVATLLSGSRTAVIGLGLTLCVLIFRSGLRRQTVAIFGLCVVVAGTTLYLSPALSHRITGTTAADPALAVRTETWSRVLETDSLVDLVTGGSDWAHPSSPPGLAEGMVGAVQQVGLIGMGLFIGLFVVSTSPPHLRRWRILLLPLAISLAVDSAYLVFPTLFLPIARMFAPIEPLDPVN